MQILWYKLKLNLVCVIQLTKYTFTVWFLTILVIFAILIYLHSVPTINLRSPQTPFMVWIVVMWPVSSSSRQRYSDTFIRDWKNWNIPVHWCILWFDVAVVPTRGQQLGHYQYYHVTLEIMMAGHSSGRRHFCHFQKYVCNNPHLDMQKCFLQNRKIGNTTDTRYRQLYCSDSLSDRIVLHISRIWVMKLDYAQLEFRLY